MLREFDKETELHEVDLEGPQFQIFTKQSRHPLSLGNALYTPFSPVPRLLSSRIARCQSTVVTADRPATVAPAICLVPHEAQANTIGGRSWRLGKWIYKPAHAARYLGRPAKPSPQFRQHQAVSTPDGGR